MTYPMWTLATVAWGFPKLLHIPVWSLDWRQHACHECPLDITYPSSRSLRASCMGNGLRTLLRRLLFAALAHWAPMRDGVFKWTVIQSESMSPVTSTRLHMIFPTFCSNHTSPLAFCWWSWSRYLPALGHLLRLLPCLQALPQITANPCSHFHLIFAQGDLLWPFYKIALYKTPHSFSLCFVPIAFMTAWYNMYWCVW